MFLRVKDINIHVLIEGPPGATPLVLLHSLGTNAHIWDPQVAELSRSFRVIRPDLRGHGLTEATDGPYSMALLADDLASLLAALQVKKAHIAGISIGGMIAQAFAANHQDQVASLILCDTAMAIPPAENWTLRAAKVRAEGIGVIQEAVIANWVTAGFINAPETAGLRAMLLRTPAESYAAACEAIAAADLSASTATLKIPTLVLVGSEDKPTPVAFAQALHAAIAGSSLVIIEGAAHIPSVEKPAEITNAIVSFLRPSTTDYFEDGMNVRKQVLGEAHVARATANITDLDRDFQAFITRTAWGSVWTRPGLDRRTRSLLTIAMLASLGHEEELKLHLRASKNTGATPADIAEVLMQVAVYGGVPAANSAFRTAKEIFKEIYP
ncbi:MAG: 3-oxoadipate enol-lactonase [Acidocella sp. 20-57-95]|nr:MAG: 3-oxoadipate enol-lactonase [Acidocella sp. 20-57-95]OYV62187.1 MAG: 3-oxoadipate enol-lactonase [Acidocella sp. 21-58-7]HQT63630.1 3-oxoadipate enol-lactonase [Acidocella sp.]HQU04003.1 3-oxoadipate enol-lactonase [Acidocella sp.]